MYILQRVADPASEANSISLPEVNTAVANELGLALDAPLVTYLSGDEVDIEEITMGDLFLKGDPDVVVSRIITIQDTQKLTELVNPLLGGKRSLLDDLQCLGDEGHQYVVAEGHYYTNDRMVKKNLTLWDGNNFRLISQKELDFYVPVKELTDGEQTVHVGGYHYRERVARVVDRMNALNTANDATRLNPEWAVKQPFFVIENTYSFISEVYTDAFRMILEMQAPYLALFYELED